MYDWFLGNRERHPKELISFVFIFTTIGILSRASFIRLSYSNVANLLAVLPRWQWHWRSFKHINYMGASLFSCTRVFWISLHPESWGCWMRYRGSAVSHPTGGLGGQRLGIAHSQHLRSQVLAKSYMRKDSEVGLLPPPFPLLAQELHLHSHVVQIFSE